MIKAIIFDFGGTIVNTDKVPQEQSKISGKALLDYFKNHGIDLKLTPEQVYTKYKEGGKLMKKDSKTHGYYDLHPYDLLTKWVFPKELKNANQKLVKCIANNALNVLKHKGPSVLRPNGVETIKKLSQMGIKLGIISNTDSMNFVNKRLFNFGLLKYFDQNCIFLSALSGLRKPDPVLFKAACTDIGVKLSEACYVGDTIDKDVEGARKAGYKLQIRIIANNDSVGQGKEAKYVIKNLKEIVDIIKRENKK